MQANDRLERPSAPLDECFPDKSEPAFREIDSVPASETDLARRIMGWFDDCDPGVMVHITSYMSEHSLKVEVGWPWGGAGWAQVDASVDPPEFRIWSKWVDDIRLDVTPQSLWQALSMSGVGDMYNTFGELCPPGPRQRDMIVKHRREAARSKVRYMVSNLRIMRNLLFQDGRREICPYIWFMWWLVTWDSGDWKSIRVSFLPD